MSPRFGSIPGFLGFLEANPLAETLFKDVFGFNLPKIAVTRTWAERFDVATLEFSNTAITLGTSLVFPPLFSKLAQAASGVDLKFLTREVPKEILQQGLSHWEGTPMPKIMLARLGKSFGFFFPFAAAFWANPFFRNWATAKRMNAANFEAIIGLESEGSRQKKRSPEEEIRFQSGMAKKILAVGLAAGLGLLGLFSLAARGNQGQALSKGMNWLFHNFDLLGKDANQVNMGLSGVIFWLLPAYFGWLHAARSKNEFWEQSVKAVNGVFWFYSMDKLLSPLFKPAFERLTGPNGLHFEKTIPKFEELLKPSPQLAEKLSEPLRQQLLKLKAGQFATQLLSSVVLLGITPPLLNIFWTRHRFERDQALNQALQEHRQKNHSLQTGTHQAFQTFQPTVAPTVAAAQGVVPVQALPQVTFSQPSPGLKSMQKPMIPDPMAMSTVIPTPAFQQAVYPLSPVGASIV